MSEKQLGAAPGDESDPKAGTRVGWFGRLRAQPGFRTASVAFVLTVVLGIGSTAAYAYWSQKQDLTISGTTLGPVLPVPGLPTCKNDRPNRVEWMPVAQVDPEARYIVTFKRGRDVVQYAVPLNYTSATTRPHEPFVRSVEPYNLSRPSGMFGWVSWVDDMTVTVSTALVDVPPSTNVPVLIGQNQLLTPLSESQPLSMRYSTPFGIAGYDCR